ncbi:hypothetical protein SAMN05444484_102681 [Flavobacterium chilense]|uniref:Uncharacterized protein n=1 Tax=Flavobacterium chilense TaxID=946677 RepID=A0A1M7DQN2_9FLAO|nr:hypothetical protein SAMN05444484_102681 [Flavobacterium chilense]
MNKLLNILSLLGSFLIVFGVLFLVQDITIGRIYYVKNLIVYNFLPFKYLVFTASSLLIILRFVDFYIPKRGK